MKNLFAWLILFYVMSASLFAQDAEKQQAAHKSDFYRQLLNETKNITSNQQSYDVTYYSLDLTPDPETQLLSAKAGIIVKIISASLDHIELDFWDGMDIDSLYLSDAPQTALTYSRNNDLLSIELGRDFLENEELTISIVYNGYPMNSGYNSFVFTNFGKDYIGTFNQPYGARAWWPCKDYPVDKPDSIDIKITVPSDMIVASNGALRNKTDHGEFSTYWWHHGYPIATYLVSLSIYPFFVWSDTYVAENGTEMPIMFYTFTDTNTIQPSYLVPNYKKTRSMIEFFAGIFGEYPFLDEKYGHAEWHLSFGMEHQTLTSMGDPTERRVAHELAHMWWGDMITCRTYNHIWLNEGFARYAESLWFEHSGAVSSASEYQVDYHTFKGPGTIFVEDVYFDDIFDIDLSYNKPSWVLHMLRRMVGDSVFYEIFNAYYSAPDLKHNTATTEDFQAICEQVSGLNLDKFFQQWIYGEYFPKYSSGWQYKPAEEGYDLRVEIKQVQSNTGNFWMPVDVNVIHENSSSTHVAWDSLDIQQFEFQTDLKPVDVDLDINNWILRETTKHRLTPYTDQIQLNNPFQQPGTGTLKITGQAYNPDSLNVALSVMVESFDGTVLDSITLHDGGGALDDIAGDGIFNGHWPVPEGEHYYNLHMLTYNLESGYITPQPNLSQFTTIGPISLDSYISASGDSTTQPGADFLVKLRLKNNSVSHTIPNVSADLVSKDSCISQIIQDNPFYGALSPGEIVTTSGTYLLKINPDCQTHMPLVEIHIKSDDQVFWIDTLQFGILSDLKNVGPKILVDFSLQQNFPNPFNNSTVITYQLAKKSTVELSVFNLLGQKVATLLSSEQQAGTHSFHWDAGDLGSGIYYYQLKAGDYIKSRKMVLMK